MLTFRLADVVRFLCLIILTTALATAPGGPVKAGEQIARGAAESWTELVDLPTLDPALAKKVKNGIANLLSDYQVRHRIDGYEAFFRQAYAIKDRSGLEEGATISFNFNPAIGDVTMNRIAVIRDGKVVDQLDSASFDIARRELSAESGIFNGALTVYIRLKDVRVGDVIDHARTVRYKPVIAPHLFTDYSYAAVAQPYALVRSKVIWPSNVKMAIKTRNTTIEPVIRNDGDMTVYSWESRNAEPVKLEDNVPSDEEPFPSIQFSTAASWQDIVDVVLPHYSLEVPLPDTFRRRLDDIKTRYARRDERMIEAMRIVQDDIRYVSLAMGNGSYIPRPPIEVIDSGFGDCKDKALLLAVSLRYLGIEAETALTDIDAGLGLPLYLPSLNAFDHVIVRARIGSATYWIDATNYLQGGRAENLVMPDLKYALPLVAKNARLVKLPMRIVMEPNRFVDERFVFPTLEGDPLTLSVVTTYSGAEADDMRIRALARSEAALSQDYLDYYSKFYPGIEASCPVSTQDDRDANTLIIIECYRLPAEALTEDALIENFPLHADIGVDSLPNPMAQGRRNSVWLGSPTFRKHRVSVMRLKARFKGPDRSVNDVTPFSIFDIDWRSTDTSFEQTWSFGVFAERIPSSVIGQYKKFIKRAAANTQWEYNFAHVQGEDDGEDE